MVSCVFKTILLLGVLKLATTKHYTINTNRIFLPPAWKVIYNNSPKMIISRWNFWSLPTKIPIYAKREFIIMYKNRFLSKPTPKQLSMPKGTEQIDLF